MPQITFTRVPPSMLVEEFADYITDDLMPLLEKCNDCYIDEETDCLVVDDQPIIPISLNAMEKRRCISSIKTSDATMEVIRVAKRYLKDYITVEY